MKKLISLVLAMTLVMSVFMGLGFSVSAEETADVLNVTVNDVTTQVPVGEKFTYHYTLSDLKLINTEAKVTYDSSKLQLTYVDETDEDLYEAFKKEAFPVIYASSLVCNFGLTDKILYNFSSVNARTFSDNSPLSVFEFTALEAGDVTIKTEIIEMTNSNKEFIVDKTPSGSVQLVDYTFSEYVTYVAPEIPTEEPTVPTEAPTEAPTEEPTQPEVTDATLRFAAPTSTTNRYNWSMKDVVFFYGNTTTFADNTLVTMTATADKYYTEDTGVNTLIKDNNGWTVYEVKLTAEQVAEAQAAKFVGFATADGVNRTTLTSPSNVLKAGIDTYGAYGDANTLADLNGKTFVIKDAEWGATSAISYVGYWLTDYNTIKFAAPVSLTQNSNWEDVEFFYANGGSFDTATKLQMVNTLDTTKITEPGSSYLRAGNWYIYAVSVDANVAAEIEAATNVGFARPGASNKTGFSRNVLKAKVDEYDGTYLAEAKTLDEVEGMVFVVQAPATANSYLTFHGEWQTAEKYTAGNDDLITIRFAAPIGATPASKWDTGVELYYGDTTNYRATERIAMTKTGETVEVTVDNTVLQSVVSGEWEVYEVQLTLEQVKAIDNAKAVGFIKAGSWNRTSTNFYRNIVRASKIDGNTAYKGVRESIETFDGLTFVISGEYDERYETTTYLGSWIG